MAKTKTRLKILGAIRRSPHGYDRYRALGMTVSLAILFAVPLSSARETVRCRSC